LRELGGGKADARDEQRDRPGVGLGQRLGRTTRTLPLVSERQRGWGERIGRHRARAAQRPGFARAASDRHEDAARRRTYARR
jgi:hypothetical protein